MNDFNKVSYKTRVYKRDFTDVNKLSSYASFFRTTLNAAGIVPVRIYDVNGEIYAYCGDKALRKATNGSFASTGFTANVIPLIVPIILNGVNKTLFISDTSAVADGSTISGVPYGASCALCGGRLFVADGDKIKYSEEFDFTDFSVGLDFGGFIGLDAADGEAVFLAEDAGDLFVVAQHAVYLLKPYGEQFEFTFKKLSSFRLDVKKDTVCRIGNKVCFLSGNDLCVFSDGKIQRVGTALYDLFDYSFGIAGSADGLYVLPVAEGGKNFAYVYDTVKEKEVLQDIGAFSLLGGYAKKPYDDYLYKLNLKADKSARIHAYSGEYDFGSCAKKSVCRIETHVTGSAEMVIAGDGVFRAALTEKCNRASCFVHGRLFNISFENASADFKLNTLAVSYVIHGE